MRDIVEELFIISVTIPACLSSQGAQDDSPLVGGGRLLDGVLAVLAHQFVVVKLLGEHFAVRIVPANKKALAL